MLNRVYLYDLGSAKQLSAASAIWNQTNEKGIDYGKLLTLFCLAECGLNFQDITIKKDPFGKPYQEVDPNIHFNLSHSKNVFVCVVSEKPIGIDIEKSRSFDLNPNMRGFFSESEWSLLTEKKGSPDFFELWTCKESYSKFIGLGLALPFSSFSVKRIDDQYRIEDQSKSPMNFTTFRYKTNYCISVCSELEISCSISPVRTERLAIFF